jgi:hypothetical protein
MSKSRASWIAWQAIPACVDWIGIHNKPYGARERTDSHAAKQIETREAPAARSITVTVVRVFLRSAERLGLSIITGYSLVENASDLLALA